MNTRRHFIKLAGVTAIGSGLQSLAADKTIEHIKALTFDVFGTVVDWCSSIIKEGEALSKSKGIDVNWTSFAHAWAQSYGASIQRVRSGEQPWTTVSDLLREELEKLFVQFKVTGLNPQEKENFAKAWERLDPWSDSVAGLKKLRNNFTIATLSNGDVTLLENLSNHCGIEWDRILSAEHAMHYKTDKEVYLKAAEMLQLKPEQIMMVAAHLPDLYAAAGCGFKTAFVARPLEWGKNKLLKFNPTEHRFDIVAKDFNDLAKQL